jgi:hypothetical protein
MQLKSVEFSKINPLKTVDTRSFSGVKWPGHGVNHPPLSGAED